MSLLISPTQSKLMLTCKNEPHPFCLTLKSKGDEKQLTQTTLKSIITAAENNAFNVRAGKAQGILSKIATYIKRNKHTSPLRVKVIQALMPGNQGNDLRDNRNHFERLITKSNDDDKWFGGGKFHEWSKQTEGINLDHEKIYSQDILIEA